MDLYTAVKAVAEAECEVSRIEREIEQTDGRRAMLETKLDHARKHAAAKREQREAITDSSGHTPNTPTVYVLSSVAKQIYYVSTSDDTAPDA